MDIGVVGWDTEVAAADEDKITLEADKHPLA
uniref:Uncharacterized protein n=1 Tax=Parascaris equorum TaxID=6256 RepID=A0A914RES9_PAREQ